MMIQILIGFALLTPLIVVYGIQEKKNRVRHIIVEFSDPSGARRAMPVKIGFSWTIFFFKGWALLFRGQFFEFLILFFVGSMLSSLALGSLIGFDPNAAFVSGTTIIDLFEQSTTWGIIGYVVFVLLHTALQYYYILFGNKIRLRNMYRRGMKFDNPQNGDINDLYEYIGVIRPKAQSELEPNVRQGASHTYVVPENKVEEDKNDYSSLAVSDLKLLLRSEGIQFDPASNKKELLALVEEHLVEDEPEEIEDYSKLTVNDLKLLMKTEGIIFPSSATKAQLLEMLNEHFKSQKK